MKSKLNLIAVLVCLFGATSIAQTTYSTSVDASGGQSYTVNVEIVLTGIVPVQSSCTWGYNYDVAYDYNIEIIGSSSNLYTLSGYLTCGSNQGIYFDLPNNGGSGNSVTQGNPWTSNSDCATATVESLLCDSISIQIEGPGITIQTLTLAPISNNNGSTSEWDVNGNNADSTDFIGTINESDLRFRSNNSERMRITKDGNIGIGVSTPLEKFELNGNMKLSGDVIFSDYANMNDSLDKFLFVDPNGRTSTKTLDQLKNVLYAEPIITPISYCDLTGVIQSPTWSNGANKIYSYCPQVNVGIGTNNPQKLLDVRGTTQTRNLEVGREYSNYSLISGYRTGVTSTPLLSLGQYNPQSQTEHVALELTSSGELSLNHNSNFQSSSDRVFTISNANRKIVYVNANEETLYARKIVVDEEVWPDYVFKDDYQLMPLNKVKLFIAQNGHLPNVPSAQEVDENGVDLGETAKITMEKVEELTLYLIEQQELLETQQELLKQQQEEIEKLKAELKK